MGVEQVLGHKLEDPHTYEDSEDADGRPNPDGLLLLSTTYWYNNSTES